MAHSSALLQLRILICVAGAALSALASASDAAAPPSGNPATAQELPQVTVIGNTPLAGLGLPVNEIPANGAGETNGVGEYVSGTGSLPGYTVINLHGSYRVAKNLEVFARLVNLLDRHYSTAGFLTSNAFTPSGSFIPNPAHWTNEDAVSPAQPLGIWAGLRVRLD